MRSSGRPSVVRPRWVCVGALALFLLMSVYQCGEVPIASESPGPVVSAVAKTVAPAAVAEDSIAAGLVVSAEAVAVGDEVEVEVFVDLGSSSLGAYQARLGWDASVLSLVEVSDGATAEFARAYQRAEAGALVFSQFNAQGADGRVSLLRVRFLVVGGSGLSELGLSFSVLDAAGTFASLLPSLVVGPTAIEIGGAVEDGIRGGLVVSAEAVEIGEEVEMEVFVDLSGSGASLGAYQARLGWDASVLSLVEMSDGSTAEFARAYQRAEAGALVFSQFNAQGVDGRVSLLRMRFLVVGGSGLSELALAFSVLDAAGTFASLLPELVVEPAAIEIGGGTGDSIVAGLVVSAEAVAVGDEVEVEVFVDLGSSSLGAYQARLDWDASVLSLMEVADGATAEFARAYQRAEAGALVFSQFNAQGAAGRVSLLRVRFSVVGSGSSGLGLSFSVLDASGTFASLLPELVVEPTVVEIGGVADGSIVAGLVASAEAVDVGDEFEVEVFVDLSGSGMSLGAYEARLGWDTAVLSLVEVSDGSTPEFDRAYHREESGALVFSQFNAQGAGGRVSLLRVRFLVVGSGSSGLGLAFSVLDAAGTFASLLPELVVEDLTP